MIITKMTFAVLVSLIFEISLSVIYFSKKRVDNDENRVYQVLIVSNGIGLILHLICDMVSFYFESLPIFFSTFFLKSLLVYYLLFGVYLLLYLLKITFPNHNHISSVILYVFLILSCFIIFFLPQNIVIDKSSFIFYTNGMDTKYVFIASGIIILIMYFIIFTMFKKIDKKKVLPLIVFTILAGLSTSVQKVYPDIVFTDCIETIIILLMYFTIENPDVKMIQKLELAKEHADKANNAKTDFLSSMSHEIRTPLNAIVGFSDCIMDANTLDEAKENAKDIISASNTLLEIVNGILDISKIEAGKLEIVNSKYNAYDVFTELAKLITPRMNEKGLDFSYYIAPDVPTVLYGDHANIKKVVTNLLSNACKYTDKGFVRYEVNCVNMNGVSRLIISVEDSGRGIKKDSIGKLFTKFQRLEEDRNTTIEGTGLGLAITKQLTELMGGKIIVHTVYGEGSKFTVVINQRIEKVEEEKSKHIKDTLNLENVKILLVDDVAMNLKVATKLLEKFHANSIDTCTSGFECIQKIQDGNDYDLILLDDMMPKMSGVTTLQKLKEIPDFHIPTVALTANAITGMREKYLADGFDDYLAKPIEKEQLIQVVNGILGRTITSDIQKIEKEEIKDNDDSIKNTIIPVDDNIEEQLGDKLDLSKTGEIAMRETTTISTTPEVNQFPQILSVVDIQTPTVPVADISPSQENVVNEPVLIPIDNAISSEKYDEQYLRNNGVDLDHALELLGDMEMYNSTIQDFLQEVEDKWNRIVQYRDQKDMENYAIDVHSLKSDCKYLGFMTLADIAYQHELKSKENDYSYVVQHFSELEAEYKKVLEIAKNYSSSIIS